MILRNPSIRVILGLIIGFMGVLALLLALASSEVIQQNAYTNQRLSMQKLINLKAQDLLTDLTHKSSDLAATLQKGKAFEEAFGTRDARQLDDLLHSQFHDFYVTTGLLKLEALYVLEPDFRLVSRLRDDGSPFDLFNAACAPLVKLAQTRHGPARMKILSGECVQSGHPYHVVIQPIGGLRLKGYLAVVTDPTHNLLQLETALGMPLSILLPDRTRLYQSPKWPDPASIGSSLLAELPLKLADDASPALILVMADDMRPLNRHLPETRLVVLSTVLLITISSMLLAMWVLRQTTTKPLQKLTDHLRMVRENRTLLGQSIQLKGTRELQELARSFNEMSGDLAKANQELLQEVSIRKQAETELRAHRDELEKLVEVRTKDLEAARDEALQASQSKSAFIANVSHEIRTPLTPIIGFAETMLQDDPDPETRRSLLGSIVRNGRHLFNVINEILDLSKIEANRLEIEKIEVDVSQLFHDIESVIGMLAREKGLEFHKAFTSPVPRRIHSDPTRIKQILMNLLTNAIKFTEQGHVGLYLDFDVDAKQLEFTVCDTGIGIPQDKQERLFQAFSQADSSTSRRFGGTGLGLYISQRLARLLGGDIKLKSLEGVGTKFMVTIAAEGDRMDDLISTPDSSVPLSYGATEAPAALPRLSGHVLLAEDTPDNQRLISHYIGKTGAKVSVAENGQVALEMAMIEDYDLILMDMQMPVMSGAEAVEMLRAAGCQTPIVALTANAMKGEREKYTRIGCNDFLGKPIRQSIFYQTLARYLPSGLNDPSQDEEKEDAEFLQMQAGFLGTLPGYVERLQSAAANQDHAAIQEEAHKLKGLGGSFGFPEITSQAAALEMGIKAGQYDDVSRLCRQLCDLLERCMRRNTATA